MLEITNWKVYDLKESVIASAYAMMTDDDEVQWRVKNLGFWLNFKDFLPNFVRFYNNQNKNIGENTKTSCLKCGSDHRVQRVFAGSGNGNFYCGKHCHELYRYGSITEKVTYTFLDNNRVEISIKGNNNNIKKVIVSAVDVPFVFGKSLQVMSLGYLLVDGKLFHRSLCESLGLEFEVVDHIDRNTTNNDRRNLRVCSSRQNLLNKGKQKKIESSEIIGVNYRKDRNKWRAYISIGHNTMSLGNYENKEDAIKARLKKEREIFGEYSPNIHFFEKYGIDTPSLSCLPIDDCKYDLELAVKDFGRIMRLAKQPQGSGHRNAMKGIRVAFDIKYPNYISPELQRYHFLDIVTSSSKMHRLVNMDMDACFNKYVCIGAKEMMKELIARYNNDKSYENFMRVISNCPQGIELFMRCTTNYEQLATIYKQRKHHKLKEDWGAFCKFIEELPYAKELIICDK